MARELQYDSSRSAVVHNLYAAIFDSQLKIWNGTAFVEQTDASATAANCCLSLTRIGTTAFYWADAPAGIVTLDTTLTGPYSLLYYDAAAVTLVSASVVGSQQIGTATLATEANATANKNTVVAAIPGVSAIAAGVWGFLLASADALASTTVGKWLRTKFGANDTPVGTFDAASVWSVSTRTLTGSGGAVGPTAGVNNAPIPFTVVPHQSVLLSARVSMRGQYATIAGTSHITYTIRDCDAGQVVAGHDGVALTPASVLYDTLQSDAAATDFNFRFQPDLSLGDAFAREGRFMVAVTFTPVSGLPFWCDFDGVASWR